MEIVVSTRPLDSVASSLAGGESSTHAILAGAPGGNRRHSRAKSAGLRIEVMLGGAPCNTEVTAAPLLLPSLTLPPLLKHRFTSGTTRFARSCGARGRSVAQATLALNSS